MKPFPAVAKRERALFFWLSLVAVLTFIPILPVLRLDGPPYPRHDWVWPIVPQSLSQILAFATSAWSPQGLGSPNLYPTIAPLYAAMYGFSKAFGLRGGLDVFIAIVYLTAAFGAFRVTLLIRAKSYPVAALGAVAYILSPVFADQLVAGHLADLLALAGLPWLIAGVATAEDSIIEGVVLAVFGAAFCLVQVQFIALMPCAVIVIAAALRSRRAALVGLCTFVAGAILESPTIYQILRVHGNAPLLQNERTVVAWELNQSASLHDAFAGQGYFAHYASVSNLPAVFQMVAGVLYYAIPAALIISLIFCWRRNRLVIGLLLVYIVGLLTLSGLKGPASTIWLNLFVRVNAASVMRELFHAAGFVALPLAVLCASAIRRFKKPLSGVAVALCALVLICVDAPAVASIGQPWLMHPSIPKETAAIVDRIAHSAGNARGFIFPGRQPVVAADGTSGVDPLEHYPIGQHPVFFNYFPIGIDALASDLVLNRRRGDYQAVFSRMSIRNVGLRPQPRVNITALAGTVAPLRLREMPKPVTPSHAEVQTLRSKRIVYGAQIPLLVSGDYSRLFDNSVSGDVLAFMRDAPKLTKVDHGYRLERGSARLDRLISTHCGELITVSPSVMAVDPHSGWVKSVRFGYADAALDYPLNGSIVTQEARPASLAIPPGSPVLFAVLSGSRNERFSWGRLPKTIASGTALAVAGYFRSTPSACTPLRPAAGAAATPVSVTAIHRLNVTHLRGSLQAQGSVGTLVFTDAFDPAWQLRIDGTPVGALRHFKADGFANGWVFSTTPGVHDYDILYGVQAGFGVFTSAEFSLWVLTLSGVLLLAGRRLLLGVRD